jgi:hypothetical protein
MARSRRLSGAGKEGSEAMGRCCALLCGANLLFLGTCCVRCVRNTAQGLCDQFYVALLHSVCDHTAVALRWLSCLALCGDPAIMLACTLASRLCRVNLPYLSVLCVLHRRCADAHGGALRRRRQRFCGRAQRWHERTGKPGAAVLFSILNACAPVVVTVHIAALVLTAALFSHLRFIAISRIITIFG